MRECSGGACRRLPLALLALAALFCMVSGCRASAPDAPSAPPAAAQGVSSRPPVPPLESATALLQPLVPQAAALLAHSLQNNGKTLPAWTELAPALQHSLDYALGWPPEERAFEHSGMRVNWGSVVASLRLLQSLLPRLDAEPELLAAHFQWLHLTPQTRFTAYYSPSIRASRTRKPGYEHPLYRLPEELAPELAHCLPSHTCPEEAFKRVIRPETPYLGRAAIDLDGALRGRGLEMAWVQHPFDAYLLMLEGSGMLEFDDGTVQAALFAGLNGNRGQSMAGYLIRTGQIARKNATMEGLRQWWDSHPRQRRAFLEAASGYAFFRYGAPTPLGTAGCPLTPWASMAVDERVLPLGGILVFDLPLPGRAMRGLGFAHDTGSAIKMRRIDMYAGAGEQAHQDAMRVYTKGEIWLLLPKNMTADMP